jgi:hypothetical protein
LEDEIRITVIATGFKSQHSSNSKDDKAIDLTTLEEGTYRRRNKLEEISEDMVLRDNFEPPTRENMEIPTFLRRQMD